ncbi:hypothetical protein [Bradyrhizobium sp. CER78]|uniref:hypothetical protein n=1 Tax=Bradyrhizobium sp. CER78 TaxID=3039162 RepID=UPI0024492D97|nr:hypothetical protein [Bradyrhizobium sp. CER78]MDH2384078.1 hypothetical protein [Bradyrhizobium sp. CER78]
MIELPDDSCNGDVNACLISSVERDSDGFANIRDNRRRNVVCGLFANIGDRRVPRLADVEIGERCRSIEPMQSRAHLSAST